MAGAVRFKVELFQPNADVLPEMAFRAADLSPAYRDIINEWARDNLDKFGMSVGQEASGAQIDPTVFWDALSPDYMKTKRKKGQPDNIMVATGSLMASLTDPERFFQMVNPEMAIFGAPNDADDAMKVQFNWIKRQAIFISLDDQRMIQKKLSDYLALGADYKEKMFVKGLQNLALRAEVHQMDVDFQNDAGGTFPPDIGGGMEDA